jgi:hypothetical protein
MQKSHRVPVVISGISGSQVLSEILVSGYHNIILCMYLSELATSWTDLTGSFVT